MRRAAFAGLLLSLATFAHAQSYVWNGLASNLWSNPLNWAPTGVPAAGDSVEFPHDGGRLYPLPVVNDLNGLSITS